MPEPIMEFFAAGHLPPLLRNISEECAMLATYMDERLEPDPEKSAGLRHLMEAKDCFVRAAIRQERKRKEIEGQVAGGG